MYMRIFYAESIGNGNEQKIIFNFFSFFKICYLKKNIEGQNKTFDFASEQLNTFLPYSAALQ